MHSPWCEGSEYEATICNTDVSIIIQWDMSRIVRKPAFCICENKNAVYDQRLCFRYTDSTIPLLPKSRSGAVVRALDFGPMGPWFEPRPVHKNVALSKSHLPCLVLVEPRKRWTDDRLGQTVTRLEITLCRMC